ncbi:MAG: sugar phosphate isomerase/epimerase [Clostridiales bacterium]|nr:sugar phosphate isomerase/epimerase [Clostridiales bacterium]
MLYGCCTNMLIRNPGSIGEEYFGILADLGYDYVELPLCDIAGFSREQLLETRKMLENTLPVRSCNNFFPNDIHLVGEFPTSMTEVREYAKRALAYAAELGASITVFGSPWAKRCPEGYSRQEAFRQLTEVCGMLGDEAEKVNITIALEPNNRLETNMINTFDDVLELIAVVNHPRIRGLQDYFHLKTEKDNVDSMIRGKDYLIHTHFARYQGRRFPKSTDEDAYYEIYLRTLQEIGYQGGISVEGFIEQKGDFRKDAADALAFFVGA